MNRVIRMTALALCCAVLFPLTAHAQVTCSRAQSAELRAEDLVPDGAQGILIHTVPQEGTLLLHTRQIRPGDVLPASCLDSLVFTPEVDEQTDLTLTYYPIQDGSLGDQASLTMHIYSDRDEAPTALDGEMETYKNIPNSGLLHCTNDDDGSLRFQIVNHPRRGAVELLEDGAFVYTPKKNKAGEDRFTFTVTDEAGNVSNEAEIRVRILQPIDSQTFADLDRADQFCALWLRSMGLFGGETVADRLCFCPDKTVSRGEFLVMAMDLGGLEPDITLAQPCFADEDQAPAWMRPYLATALRRGIVRGVVQGKSLCFEPNRPVTGYEAAVMLTGALGIQAGEDTVDAMACEDAVPAWAEQAVGALRAMQAGAPDGAALTRARAAELLYLAALRSEAG